MRERELQAGSLSRRSAVLGAALTIAPGLATRTRAGDAAATPDPTEMRPQVGDHFVLLETDKPNAPVRVEDLELGGPQVQAYPASPQGIVRDGSRLNLVLLSRVGDDGLSDETRARSADGVVAYSGVCTHQGCPVNMWEAQKKAFVCSCHQSTYDPRQDAAILFGPAPRPLPALPLKSENGVLLVAGDFTSRIGPTKS